MICYDQKHKILLDIYANINYHQYQDHPMRIKFQYIYPYTFFWMDQQNYLMGTAIGKFLSNFMHNDLNLDMDNSIPYYNHNNPGFTDTFIRKFQ